MPYKTSVKKIALIINKMKLLIRVLVALLAFCLSTAQKSESYEFTSRLFCTNIDGKRHCVPCSSSNGVITCVPSAISASIQSSGLPSNGNNGIEVGSTTGSAINNIHAPGNRYYTGASAQSNGLQGSGNIRPNYGSNILVGYSPIYDHNINSGGRTLSPTLQPIGNNYFLNSSQSRGFQGNANGVYNHRGNIENGGSASPYDSYVDGPDNIPSFD